MLLEGVEEREEREEDDEDAAFSLTSTNALMPNVPFKFEYHSFRKPMTQSTSIFFPAASSFLALEEKSPFILWENRFLTMATTDAFTFPMQQPLRGGREKRCDYVLSGKFAHFNQRNFSPPF